LSTELEAVCQETSNRPLCPAVSLEVVELFLFVLIFFVVVGGTFFCYTCSRLI